MSNTATNGLLKTGGSGGLSGQSVEELAMSLNVNITYTKEIENNLYHDMLISLYRREPLTFEQQKSYEESQAKATSLKKEIPLLDKIYDASQEELKGLKRAKARLTSALGRSVTQIKEDLTAFGLLAENASSQEVMKAVKEEQEKMLDVAEKVAEIDFDIDVATKENNNLYEKKVALKEELLGETEAIDYWVDLQAHNAEMNQKVSEAYKELTGIPFNKDTVSRPLPMFLQGIPGQGKTAVYSSAAKRVCKKLKLNFIGNLNEAYQPQRNDFVMVVQDCAGENSGLLFGGMPKTEEMTIHTKRRFALTKAFNKRFLGFETAAGGVLLFDDASNANMNIQNMLLPIMQNSSFAGMLISNCLVGGTGNLGSIDQTHIHAMSTALKTRVLAVFTADSVSDFTERMEIKYPDNIGSCGVLPFLEQFNTHFGRVPGVERTPLANGFACSRTYEDLIGILRNKILSFGGRGRGEEELLKHIAPICKSKLGNEVGEELTTYLRSYFSGTNELALAFINAEKEEDLKAARDKFSAHISNKGIAGISALGVYSEFTSSLIDHTLTKLVEFRNSDKKETSGNALKLATEKFSNAITGLQDDKYALALAAFRHRLTLLDAGYTSQGPAGNKVLSTDNCLLLGEVFATTKGVSKDKKEIIASQLSGYAEIEKSVSFTPSASRPSLVS